MENLTFSSLHRHMSLVLLILLLFTITACKKEEKKEPVEDLPLACFKTESYKTETYLARVGQVVNFKNCSENFDVCEWNFSDGSSSTISEPAHTWQNAGTYPIDLIAFKGTKSDKITKNIVVVNKGVRIKFAANFTDWNLSNNFAAYHIHCEQLIGPSFTSGYSLHQSMTLSPPPEQFSYFANTDPYIDDLTKFKFKLYIEGGNQFWATNLIDTLVTSEIGLLTGAQTPTAVVKISSVTITYTITTIND